MTNTNNNPYLLIAAGLTAMGAIAHLGCAVFGGDWYRFFGAGEQMAVMSEQGHWYPATITSVIAAVLLLWSAFALSGAGVIRRLPLTRLALVVISIIFLARAMGFYWLMPAFPENTATFWFVSSSICFTIGFCFAFGTYKAWPRLTVL